MQLKLWKVIAYLFYGSLDLNNITMILCNYSIHTITIVHCEWNDWIIGECSKSCGGGTRVDTRTVKVEAKHGGDTCPGPTSIEKSCNVQECPGEKMFIVNCVEFK